MVHIASLSSTRKLKDSEWEEVPFTAMVYMTSHMVLQLWEQSSRLRIVQDVNVTLYTKDRQSMDCDKIPTFKGRAHF